MKIPYSFNGVGWVVKGKGGKIDRESQKPNWLLILRHYVRYVRFINAIVAFNLIDTSIYIARLHNCRKQYTYYKTKFNLAQYLSDIMWTKM